MPRPPLWRSQAQGPRPTLSRRARTDRRPRFEALEGRQLLATLFVAPGGSDSNPAGNSALPLQSIQHAVTVAHSGDLIKVAAGTYSYSASADREGNYTQNFGASSVFTLINKQLTVIGGFSTGNWGAYNPTGNVTVIDGGNQLRGALVVGGTSATSLDLRGFTVTRGLGRGIPARGGTDAIDGIGGGVFVDGAPASFQDVLFSNNRAIGNETGQAVGGAGAGGGLAMRASSNATVGTLTNVSFVNNLAQGSSGASRGGFGQGGGLFTYQYTVNGTNLSFQNNRAIGGSTNGGGFANGDLGDAQGGGLAIHIRSVARLNHVTATGNQAIGGPAPNGDAGGAYGGGVYGEIADMTLSDSVVRDNLARGGDGNNGGTAAAGFGNGGGLMTVNTNTRIERSQFLSNTAQGGTGAVFKGVSGGGGLALVRLAGYSTFAVLNNSLVAGNTESYGGGSNDTRGGGGGGLWVDGPDTNILQSTIADNKLVGSVASRPTQQGQALVVGPAAATRLTLAFTAIVNHTNNLNAGNGFAAALHVHQGSTVTMARNLFANNSNDSNSGGTPNQGGTYNGYATSIFPASLGAQSPGAPQYNYQLATGSPAIDAAPGSDETIDITGQARNGTPDIGAYEYRGIPTPTSTRYVLNDYDNDGKSDLAAFRPGTGQWFVRFSGGGVHTYQMGDPGQRDFAVPGDYDGDGVTDLAVFRPGTAQWFIRYSTGGGRTDQMGDPGQGDIPAPGDYDGDHVADLAVFRPSTAQWFIRYSGGGGRSDQLGDPRGGDRPVPADFDGDGRTDLAVFRPGTAQFFIRKTSGGSTSAQFGDPRGGDRGLAGDYDGDRLADFAAFRPGSAQFFIRFARGGGRTEQLGDPAQRDIPAGLTPPGISASGGASVQAASFAAAAPGVHAASLPNQGATAGARTETPRAARVATLSAPHPRGLAQFVADRGAPSGLRRLRRL